MNLSGVSDQADANPSRVCTAKPLLIFIFSGKSRFSQKENHILRKREISIHLV